MGAAAWNATWGGVAKCQAHQGARLGTRPGAHTGQAHRGCRTQPAPQESGAHKGSSTHNAENYSGAATGGTAAHTRGGERGTTRATDNSVTHNNCKNPAPSGNGTHAQHEHAGDNGAGTGSAAHGTRRHAGARAPGHTNDEQQGAPQGRQHTEHGGRPGLTAPHMAQRGSNNSTRAQHMAQHNNNNGTHTHKPT